MGHKRKKEEEEEPYEFKLPEFDEREFMEKEVVKTKAAIVTIGYAVVIAIASLGLTLLVQPALGGLVGIIGLVMIGYVFDHVGVDTSAFDKKDWMGPGMIYIFIWLGIWVLLLNPPFNDLAHPDIGKAEYSVDGGNFTVFPATNVLNVSAGQNVSIRVRMSDNSGIETVQFRGYNGSASRTVDGIRYTWTLNNVTAGEYNIRFYAADKKGNEIVSPTYYLGVV